MKLTLTFALAATFLGVLVLVVGYGNRWNKWGLPLMYAGVVILLSILSFHIHMMLEGGY